MAKKKPGQRGPGGFEPGLDDALLRKIHTLAGQGLPRYQIARLLAIPHRTWAEWLRRGKLHLNPKNKKPVPNGAIYAKLITRIHQADAEHTAKLLACIIKAAETQWQAAAWGLERKLPEFFASRGPEIRRLDREIAKFLKEQEQQKTAPNPGQS